MPERVFHSLGLEGDSRIRVDHTLSDGIRQAALENNASLFLLGSQGPRPTTSFLVESVNDEISRLVECPVAVAMTSELPTEQVVLAISKHDLNASRIDNLHAAVSIAAAAHQRLIVGPVDPAQLAGTGIVLPEKTEYKPSDKGIVPWVEQTSEKDSLVISIAQGWSFDRLEAMIHQRSCSLVAIT